MDDQKMGIPQGGAKAKAEQGSAVPNDCAHTQHHPKKQQLHDKSCLQRWFERRIASLRPAKPRYIDLLPEGEEDHLDLGDLYELPLLEAWLIALKQRPGVIGRIAYKIRDLQLRAQMWLMRARHPLKPRQSKIGAAARSAFCKCKSLCPCLFPHTDKSRNHSVKDGGTHGE